MKRAFDFITALITLSLLSPIMILVAILIRLESRGQVIFQQERVGRYGKLFSIYKFRSMVVGASSQGPHYTQDNDARITKIGRFIRKTSIDELPQVINVLMGDMSIVGPRPDLQIQQVEYKAAEWDKRISVRPGITGLAQARLRSTATHDERTRFDLEYVESMAFGFDIWIIFLTAKQVLFKGGN